MVRGFYLEEQQTRRSNDLSCLIANSELVLLDRTGYYIIGHGWPSTLAVHPWWAAMTFGVPCIIMSVVST